MKKLLFLLLVLFIAGCTLISPANTYIPTERIKTGMTTNEVHEIMGKPNLSELYNNIDEWHYCRTGVFKDIYAVLFFIDDKLISKQHFVGNMIKDDIKNITHTGNCENFIKDQDYKIPPEVQAILDKNTPTPAELKEPKEPIEPEEGVMPTVSKVEIPNQPKPPKTQKDE